MNTMPSKYLREPICTQKAKQDAEALIIAILDGYQDAVAERGVVYQGNLRDTIAKVKQKEKGDWQ